MGLSIPLIPIGQQPVTPKIYRNGADFSCKLFTEDSIGDLSLSEHDFQTDNPNWRLANETDLIFEFILLVVFSS